VNQTTFNVGTGALGAIITYAYGGWTEALSFLLIATAIDIITGISASLHEGRGLNSTIGAVGFAKKGLMLLVILLAHRIDILMALDNVTMTAAIYFYIGNELVSITENLGRNGMPLPDKIRDVIDVLKRKGDVTPTVSGGIPRNDPTDKTEV
jgi:toxin secretion/phage lysis holin